MNDKYFQLTETFDVNKLAYILDNFAQFKPQLRWRDRYNIIQPTKISRKYIERSRPFQGIGKVLVDYKQNGGKGRFCAMKSMSLQVIPREIRHSIARDYYHDIDMCNAHPVILSYLCRNNNIPSPALDEYITNREDLLREIVIDNRIADRDKGKQIYLALTNGGTKDFKLVKHPSDHLLRYRNEMLNIHDRFAELDDEAYQKTVTRRKDADKDYNHKAGYMNTLLCDMENNLLMIMHKFFGSPDDCVLCFDGIMVLKRDSDNFEINYDIPGCMLSIERAFPGMNMILKLKDMDEPLNMNTCIIEPYTYKSLEFFIDFKNLITDFNTFIYPEHVNEWISSCLVVVSGGGDNKFLTKNKAVCPESGEISIYYRHVAIQKVLASLSVNCSIIDIRSCATGPQEFVHCTSFYDVKHEDPNLKDFRFSKMNKYVQSRLSAGLIPTYEKSDFIPYLKIKGIPQLYETFNTFGGFHMECISQSDDLDFTKSLMYNHLLEVICHGDLGEFNHFLDHLADIIQDPSNVKPNAHVFYTSQGAGKGVMVEWFRRVIGNSLVASIVKLDRYFNNSFNSHYSFKLVKIFEELGEKGIAFKNFNRLKGEISAPTEFVELKGMDAYEVRNCARMWLFTNHDNSVFIESDDRRYTMHRGCNKYADCANYFDPLWEELRDTNNIKCAFDFLSTREYSPASARRCFHTDYKSEQKINNLSNGVKFIIHYIEHHYDADCIENATVFPITTKELLNDFRTWCSDASKKDNFNAKSFATQIEKIGLKDTKRKIINGSRVYCHSFSPIVIEGNIQTMIRDPTFKFQWFKPEDVTVEDNILSVL